MFDGRRHTPKRVPEEIQRFPNQRRVYFQPNRNPEWIFAEIGAMLFGFNGDRYIITHRLTPVKLPCASGST